MTTETEEEPLTPRREGEGKSDGLWERKMMGKYLEVRRTEGGKRRCEGKRKGIRKKKKVADGGKGR